MHIPIVNFQLNGFDDAQYRRACEAEAPDNPDNGGSDAGVNLAKAVTGILVRHASGRMNC
jgi:hypothetical protein